MRHVLSALVQNVPGVLSHISGMLASRGYNIDSLAVGETEDPQLSRMTFVVVGDDAVLEQVRKQLEKIVTVVRVDDIGGEEHIERDLMLMKVKSPPGRRSEIRELTDIFRAADRQRRSRDGDRRDLRPGAEGRGIHRDDAALRHRGVGPHRPHRHDPWRQPPRDGIRPVVHRAPPSWETLNESRKTRGWGDKEKRR